MQKELAQKLQKILKLDTSPVAIKLYRNRDDLPLKPLQRKLNICQLVYMARAMGKANSGTPDKMVCSFGAACAGLIKTPDVFKTGEAAVGIYCKDNEAGKNFFANTFKLGDKGKEYDAMYVEPLEKGTVEPDVVVVHGNSGQIVRLIHANAYDSGEKVSADSVAEGALCSSIGYVLEHNKPRVDFPCAGERVFGGAQNHEIVFVTPYNRLEKLVENLEHTARGGFSVYPAPIYMDWSPTMPSTYTIKEEDL
ncbi:DUF169 domain-containing protein [Halothermothrix orenii]|uniref:Uncharacterized protein conserved in archaea n=1 Tax=Halothermothrix orenii (strain H 168 / OCM 544 / DSM 9562) TaxID=373903 RepID=B8CZZ5_HALOH|nr:DUF169 domain-containing protein [Halothermothrix orenii]ACL70847.1 uncharacterized protein conserved in archaea [Halothermothrix orenii H 168]